MVRRNRNIKFLLSFVCLYILSVVLLGVRSEEQLCPMQREHSQPSCGGAVSEENKAKQNEHSDDLEIFDETPSSEGKNPSSEMYKDRKSVV